MQNNVFWQSLKMLCYLPHGINSTSQKKTKQQNNTPQHPLVLHCDRRGHGMATEVQLYLLHSPAGLCCHGVAAPAGGAAGPGPATQCHGLSLTGTEAEAPLPFSGSLSCSNSTLIKPHGQGSSVPGISPNISFHALLWRASPLLLLKINLGHLLL